LEWRGPRFVEGSQSQHMVVQVWCGESNSIPENKDHESPHRQRKYASKREPKPLETCRKIFVKLYDSGRNDALTLMLRDIWIVQTLHCTRFLYISMRVGLFLSWNAPGSTAVVGAVGNVGTQRRQFENGIPLVDIRIRIVLILRLTLSWSYPAQGARE